MVIAQQHKLLGPGSTTVLLAIRPSQPRHCEPARLVLKLHANSVENDISS